MAKRESMQHQRTVQGLCRNLIKDGCPPERIKISGIQNPDIESWARRKGVIFDKKQEFDILHPEEFDLETK